KRMPHLDEGTIHAWLEGGLSPSEAALTEEHIAGCDECSAAVAEARGLIAASSRILTALDDVPAGVIPSRAPRARPWYMRRQLQAAAAVLLVAGTTLVLIQGGQQKQIVASRNALPAAAVAADTGVPPQAGAAASESVRIRAASAEPEKPEIAAKKSVDAVATKPAAVADRISASATRSREELLEKSEAGRAMEPVMADAARQHFNAAVAVTGGVANAPAPKANALVQPAPVAIDSLRVVSVERRRIGWGPRTTYEVSPGVQVVLTEQVTTGLEEVVVAAPAGVARRDERAKLQAAEKQKKETLPVTCSADTTAKVSPEGTVSSVQRTTGAPSLKAVLPATIAPAPAAQKAAAPISMNSLRWSGQETGSVYALTGPLSCEELKRVKALLSDTKR
ncbi:MAG TPA: zf-HC2 domain-containing protein, partial [Gemmatimonadaceae bacterium]